MTNYTVDAVIRQIATNSISGYQKYISPRKGFSCAFRLLYKGESCSEYVKKAIAQEGLVAAINKSRDRFQACREANQILKTSYYRSSKDEEKEDSEFYNRKEKAFHNRNNTCLDPVDCSCAVLEISDCSALDCGHLASSLDCIFSDCRDCIG
jgi:putative component of membrane protein insertase Oxa1/YidC/SpoIIIJ protein YidD